ncbi:GNAT family N-acetyltransferase [Parasphingopyxis algicola]|uniref:GNAT family N-acetyltransferase n=1 Tax=Parasphingopyxis algicola TaxID=2026624 RepID=UPI0015A03DEB|nr:GNAT family N-acetyltransferase [Parasphingopyxis algicola]QLC25340.1 GNAT family N-acetyltransferase [Parasphingopyxis algicola]
MRMHPAEARSVKHSLELRRAESACAAPVVFHDGLTIPEPMHPAWDALAPDAAEPNPFAERWFLEASQRYAAGDDACRMAVVGDETGLVGITPLGRQSNYGRLSVDHVENWQHANMFLGTPLIRRGREEAFWTALITALDEDDWARGFLHLDGLVEDGPVHRGLEAAARSLGRECAIVHREERALLHSGLSPDDYLKQNLRKKRRDECKRLRRRLAELGHLDTRELQDAGELAAWCDDFLEMERSGWKGETGSALSCCPDATAFFRETLTAAFARQRLHFLRLELDGKPIAMLTSLLARPGAFGFKACFDQDYARFSPGLLLQIDNLRMLDDPDIDWQDSCTSPGHPVEKLWSERRLIVRVTVDLKGLKRRLVHAGARALEKGSRKLRELIPGTAETQPARDAGKKA